MKLLHINAKNKKFKTSEVKEVGPVERAIKNYQKKNIFSFGTGPLAFTQIPGTNRLIFAHKSNLWDGFFISTMGGASVPLIAAGINFVEIEGSCKNYSIIKIANFNNKIIVKFEEVDGLEKIFQNYKGKKGVYALQQYIYDKFSEEYIKHKAEFRIIAAGPASMKTLMGALCSTQIQNKQFIEGLDSWAGRGGFGSTLTQEHKIIGIIYGGNSKTKPSSHEIVNKIFEKKFEKNMTQTILDATKKYRYDPSIKTGGTFGSNFATLQTWFVSFNWNSIKFSEEKRREMYSDLIKNHYLKQFNEEIIEKKSFKTCGEPCPVVCKKYHQETKLKKDYEPYEANGPNSGIFDQRAAEKLVSYVDELGFDAIEAGNMISWIMDMLNQGIIKKENYNINKNPKFEYNKKSFDIIKDSMHNAEVGKEITNIILNHPTFQKGIRNAAKKLGREATNLAVYTPHKKGGITPCMYWVPAFLLPIAIQGKFLSDYHLSFNPPKKLGQLSTERMIKEMYSDNMGICRFHRGWSEKIVETLLKELLKKDINMYEYSKKIVKKIYSITQTPTKTWESEKVYDILKTYLKKLYTVEKENKELKRWVEKFEKNKIKAGTQYWKEIIEGIEKTLK